MYSTALFNYYKGGRFLIAITLLISLQIAGLPFALPNLVSILGIYCFIALFRLIIEARKIIFFDFLLDIVFISAMVYASFDIHSYLTLLYLFPIFFSSVLIRTKFSFLFPIIAAILYASVYYLNGMLFERESIMNVSLHVLSFLLITLAGDNMKVRMERQEGYIKRLEEEKIKMQGYERLYRVSADLAHELRNPLASISAAAQFLKEGRNDKEFIDMLISETERLTNLVKDFLLFSRPTGAPTEDIDISDMLETLIDTQQHNKQITLHKEANAEIKANRVFLNAAINNILKNAIEAARSNVKVLLKKDLSLNVDIYGAKEKVVIEIEDDGAGIDEGIKDRLFEPFVTTKTHGTGLGLAIAYRIVTGYGGNILVDKSQLGGAKFTIVLPMEEMER